MINLVKLYFGQKAIYINPEHITIIEDATGVDPTCLTLSDGTTIYLKESKEEFTAMLLNRRLVNAIYNLL